MSKFKLPFLSPLAGTTHQNLRKVLMGNRIAPRYYLKVFLTRIFVLISSAFQWIDKLKLRRKVKNYTFKESPLFIVGHWRSGTTFLHNLLSRDPTAAIVTTYHAVFPNNLKSQWIFKTFMRLFMPSERPGDQMKISVNFPQEDKYALSNFTYRSFYHFFYFPSKYKKYYQRYVRFTSQTEDEIDAWKLDYRKLVVQALINTKGRRAILKNPVNTARIRLLLDIFPDAKFVFIVRNPIIVYLSTKKFFSQLLPTLNLEDFTNEQISRMVIDLYERLLKDYISDKKHVNQNRIIEIRYEDFELNPVEGIQEIYAKFSLGDAKLMKTLVEDYLESQGSHKEYKYSISKNELDEVMPKLQFAMNHWNYSIPENFEILSGPSKSDFYRNAKIHPIETKIHADKY